MAKQSLAELAELVTSVIRRSPLAERVGDVRLEEGEDGDGFTFLRVFLTVRKGEEMTWARIGPTVREIEDEIGERDERFPSVRLADAA